MKSLDYWRLCDHVSIFQAIILILGADPSEHYSITYEERMTKEDLPVGYEALKTTIINGIKAGILEGVLEESSHRSYSYFDLDESTVGVNSLKNFLKSKGFTSGFFFPENSDDADYLNPDHPYYSPKLAAAIKAWEAVTQNHDLMKNKTPKQAIEKWLRENAARFGLTDDDGNPFVQAIEDMSKVANWQTKGGAAKTFVALPSPKSTNPPTNQLIEKEEDSEMGACPF